MVVEPKLKKLKKFDAAYFRGTQNYLVFQPVYKYFKKISSTENIVEWESKGLSNEEITSTTTSNNNNNNNNNKSATNLIYSNARLRVKFNGHFLEQNKVIYNHGAIVNIYTVYRLIPTIKDSNVTLQNCLFGAVKLTKKNADCMFLSCHVRVSE